MASVLFEVIRILIEEGPTTCIGFVSGALSKNPLCPGKNAAVAPETLPANASAEPTPGNEEIAPGMPPMGATRAVKGTATGISTVGVCSGNEELLKNLGMTEESTNEIEPLVSVTWKVGKVPLAFFR